MGVQEQVHHLNVHVSLCLMILKYSGENGILCAFGLPHFEVYCHHLHSIVLLNCCLPLIPGLRR